MKKQDDDDEAARGKKGSTAIVQRLDDVEAIFRCPHLLCGADWVAQRRCLFQVMQALSGQLENGALSAAALHRVGGGGSAEGFCR